MNDEDVPPGYGATVLRPGDSVLITFHGVMDAKTAHAITTHLEDRFAGVEFMLIDRVVSMVVQRPVP